MSDRYIAMSRPPVTALRQISGGDLRGKTDINPQWRYEIMDETLGPCGENWTYEIVRLWDYPTADGTVLCFAQINLYTKTGEEWSRAIPGVGGNTLVDMIASYGKDGKPDKMLPKTAKPNDEGYKMAVTDALSTALKMIGVAADIYRGNWDGTKYRDAPKPAQPPKLALTPEQLAAQARAKIASDKLGLTNDEKKAISEKHGGDLIKIADYLEGVVADKEIAEACAPDEQAIIDHAARNMQKTFGGDK